MASKPLQTVLIAPEAEEELVGIFRYNLKKRGPAAADTYLSFLRNKISGLSKDYEKGKQVAIGPIYIIF